MCVKLIDDVQWREEVQHKLDGLDIDTMLYNLEEDKRDFKFAFDYIVDNHAVLARQKSKEPIYMSKVMSKV